MRLGNTAIVTAPTEPAAEALRHALLQMPSAALTDPEQLRAVLPVTDVLGPATLAYVSTDAFRPAPAGEGVEQLAPGHPDVLRLTRSAPPEDTAESGVEEITSPAFVVRVGGTVAAVAGYQVWPSATAHICVLTDPGQRSRGLARQVASAAVSHALADGLLPQWRARPPESRRVAQALGFRELGSQLSIRLESKVWR
ncbi:GNAT family N-acetyltransferase [Streptomyces sp. MST-110588]|uniref:GNAT family N-acetyltransferase n=1 Tax=Streptomyces sp. MST-110588 TaxID=2833628 RepID=UPI0032429CC6